MGRKKQCELEKAKVERGFHPEEKEISPGWGQRRVSMRVRVKERRERGERH